MPFESTLLVSRTVPVASVISMVAMSARKSVARAIIVRIQCVTQHLHSPDIGCVNINGRYEEQDLHIGRTQRKDGEEALHQ